MEKKKFYVVKFTNLVTKSIDLSQLVYFSKEDALRSMIMYDEQLNKDSHFYNVELLSYEY